MKHVDHIVNECNVLKLITKMNNKLSEIENNRRDSCPFVITWHSSFQDEDNLYFELEYVEGITISSQLRYDHSKIQSNYLFYV